MTRDELVALQVELTTSDAPCVTWRREIAEELLTAADLLPEYVETNAEQSRRIEYLERRIVELDSDLSVARAGIPRSP